MRHQIEREATASVPAEAIPEPETDCNRENQRGRRTQLHASPAARMKDIAHQRVDPDPAFAHPEPSEMNVHIPHVGSVQIGQSAVNDFVLHEMRG